MKLFEKSLTKEKTPFWHLLLPLGFMKFKKRGRWIYSIIMIIFVGMISYLVFPRPELYMAAQSKEESVSFLEEQNGKYGTFISQTHEGHGQIGKDEFEVFNVVTTTGKYNFVYGAKEDNTNKFSTVAVYQQAPKPEWIFKEMDLLPTVAVALYDLKEEVGTPKEKFTKNTVGTEKGTVTFTLVNSEVTGIFLEGQKVELPELSLDLQKRTMDFVEEHKDLTGKIQSVSDYKWSKEKQSFFVVAEEGMFRIDEMHSGEAEILKGEITYTPSTDSATENN